MKSNKLLKPKKGAGSTAISRSSPPGLTGEQSNFIEIALWNGCFPVNFLHIFRTSFPKTPVEGCFWTERGIWNYLYLYEINCIKIQTTSLVLNLSILADILCVLFTLTSSFASGWKKSSNCNHFPNILRLFNVLPTFLFTTSETMRNYYL